MEAIKQQTGLTRRQIERLALIMVLHHITQHGKATFRELRLMLHRSGLPIPPRTLARWLSVWSEDCEYTTITREYRDEIGGYLYTAIKSDRNNHWLRIVVLADRYIGA